MQMLQSDRLSYNLHTVSLILNLKTKLKKKTSYSLTVHEFSTGIRLFIYLFIIFLFFYLFIYSFRLFVLTSLCFAQALVPT